eukprot:1501624-Alexandrium_andersonii.AAC.1
MRNKCVLQIKRGSISDKAIRIKRLSWSLELRHACYYVSYVRKLGTPTHRSSEFSELCEHGVRSSPPNPGEGHTGGVRTL